MEYIDMSDKICLITGSSSGIGLATAKLIADMGASVIITGRNAVKNESVKNELIKTTGNQKIDFLTADLSSIIECNKFAEDFKNKYNKLDILINNAGGIFSERIETSDGLEKTFALNYLSSFIITLSLMNCLKKANNSRIINVSSIAHSIYGIDLNDLQFKKNYEPFAAYGRSKMADILFTYLLSDKLKNTDITVNTLHPGIVDTGIDMYSYGFMKVMKPVFDLFSITPEKGAQTSVFLATSPDVENISGKYFIKNKQKKSHKLTYDRKLQESLWEQSVVITGLDLVI